jgi:hypothetical protein
METVRCTGLERGILLVEALTLLVEALTLLVEALLQVTVVGS